MNKRLKAILSAVLIILTALLVTSCKQEETPYDRYDKEGYTVSIRYDANGGTFTTNTTVINDSYNLSDFETNSNGKKELVLIAPDDTVRTNAFEAKKSGYFLAGWYTERQAVVDTDGNHLDHDGNIAAESGKDPAYTYGGLWNFSADKYEIDPGATYSASEPALTLYAAWVPEFSYEFYAMGGEKIGEYVFNPLAHSEITLPAWDTVSGKMNYNDFPEISGKTFDAAYLDAAGTSPVSGEKLAHGGVFTKEDASYENSVMKVYVDYVDGQWFRITTAEQFISNANPGGCYLIEADLDFEGKKWPLSGTFRGTIKGNGHSFSNIEVKQTSLSNNAGLFATVADTAVIENLNIVNATYSVMKGSRTNGATFGLLAGTVSENASFTNVTLSGKILISPDAQIPNIYNFGLVCGLGYENTGIDLSGITAEAIEDEDSLFVATVVSIDGNDVEVKIERKTSGN